MKLVVFEAEPRERAVFQSLQGEGCEVAFAETPLTRESAAGFADADLVSTFIYSQVSREAISRLPRLRLVATRSTGFDHIDLEACRARGVAVANVPTYGENTVAEHVFALLLTISHRLPEAIARARSGRFSPEGLDGFDLCGRTLGVVGVGSIGRCVIRIARGFGMEVLGWDGRPDPACAADLGFRYADLSTLLGASDVISLHLPALPGGRPILDQAAFDAMKTGVVLINTARGSLVDGAALVRALRSGKVAHAGLDVLAEEPSIREEAELVASGRPQAGLMAVLADHVLLNSPQVVVTPHSAFNTREAVDRIAQTTLANIRGFLAGRASNLVNPGAPRP
ncbi:MAG TPA: hydroxyacid dehydrogenase [Caulobacteraceae bacterium]|nr:hydroxyacid dehydrogenase [Caulobacteraceae bacterium]